MVITLRKSVQNAKLVQETLNFPDSNKIVKQSHFNLVTRAVVRAVVLQQAATEEAGGGGAAVCCGRSIRVAAAAPRATAVPIPPLMGPPVSRSGHQHK